MQSLRLNSLSSALPPHFHYSLLRPFLLSPLSSFSKHANPARDVTSKAPLSKTPNPLLHDFLVKDLHFSPTRASVIACNSIYSNLNSLQKPQKLVQYFQSLGFSQEQIRSSVHIYHRILLYNVDKIIKPKIEFFRQLGFDNSHLGKFFSKNPIILVRSLEKQLIPVVQVLKKVLVNDKDNKDLFKVLCRNAWLINDDIESKILPKIRFFEDCGIVGDQLAGLLIRTRLFGWDEASLRNLVSRVSDLGFKMTSRMFVHALCSVGCCSDETLKGKIRTFERFGFSKEEYMLMVGKQPFILNSSTKKSISGLDFYLNTVKLTKEVLIHNPTLLMYSLENRVMPRYRVLDVIKSKQLLKKQPHFSRVIKLSEEGFLERFISEFADHEEELLKSYNGHTLVSSPEEELSTK